MPKDESETNARVNWLSRDNLPWLVLLSLLGINTGSGVLSLAQRSEIPEEVALCDERVTRLAGELATLRADIRDINRAGPDTPAKDTINALNRIEQQQRTLEERLRALEIRNGSR